MLSYVLKSDEVQFFLTEDKFCRTKYILILSDKVQPSKKCLTKYNPAAKKCLTKYNCTKHVGQSITLLQKKCLTKYNCRKHVRQSITLLQKSV